MSAKKQTTENQVVEHVNKDLIDQTNNENKEIVGTVECKPTMTPELTNCILTGNFDYIKKNFSISKWNKCKSKEEKQKMLSEYKKLIDSMEYLGGWL